METLEFPGKIVFTASFNDWALISDQLLQAAIANGPALYVVGFDTEWPVNWSKAVSAKKSRRTAIIQICLPDLSKCYIFQVGQCRKIPAIFLEFLRHPLVRLTGLNVGGDIRKLAKDYVVQLDGVECLELNTMANTVLEISHRWSLQDLVGFMLNKELKKIKSVRLSRWDLLELTHAQLTYAATDAYASLLVYQRLNDKQIG